VVAVLALLMAAPFERGRGCDVCPVDCPMHAARRGPERQVGCHHGTDAPKAAKPADDGACAMRASCGHHGAGVIPAFEVDLPPALVVTLVTTPYHAVPDRPVRAADGPAPPDRPPRSSVA
jgi:hypothetical protein